MTLRELFHFKEAFEKQVTETIHPDMLIPEIEIDAEIDFADITLNSRILKQFEPFGPLNMTPVFLTKI
jgi:single-stranded-DNA-specific exonuclease